MDGFEIDPWLDESETAYLITVAVGRYLALAFGPRGVRLQVDKSPWAVPILVKMRGLAYEDGAGI